MAWPAMMVVSGSGRLEARGIVFESMIKEPAVFRATRVPPIVAAGSPGFMVAPAIATAFGAAVIAWPAMVVRIFCGT